MTDRTNVTIVTNHQTAPPGTAPNMSENASRTRLIVRATQPKPTILTISTGNMLPSDPNENLYNNEELYPVRVAIAPIAVANKPTVMVADNNISVACGIGN